MFLVVHQAFTFKLFEQVGSHGSFLTARHRRAYETVLERLGVAHDRMNEISLCLQRRQLGASSYNYQYFGVDLSDCDFSKTLSIRATN